MLWLPALSKKCFQNIYIFTCLMDFITYMNFIDKPSYSRENYLTYQLNPKEEVDTFDFIVVGAGTSGCVVANRLSENQNINVLLLEAGDVPSWLTEVPGIIGYWPNTYYDYNYKLQSDLSICHENPSSCVMTRGKGLGGTSTINDMTYVRGNQLDFDNWAALGNPGWSWFEVLPFFKFSEKLLSKIPHSNPMYHQKDGNLGIELFNDKSTEFFFKSSEELGYKEIDYNSGNQVGVSRLQYTRNRGKRISSNTAFIKPSRFYQQNLSIRINSKVHNLIIDPSTRKVMGVQYVTSKGKHKVVFATKEVILSAGPIETPKILMLSGIGPIEELLKTSTPHHTYLPVGKNLQDHVSASVLTLTTSNNPDALRLYSLINEMSFYRTANNPALKSISKPSLIGVTQFVNSSFESRKGVPDIQITYLKSLQKDKFHYNAISHFNKLIVKTTLLSPKSRGQVTLNDFDPINANPLINPNFFTHPDDLKTLVDGLRITDKLMKTSAFKRSGIKVTNTPAPACTKFSNDKNKYYHCVSQNYYMPMSHPAGTCKMGPPTDSNAVVDCRLRVYNIRNLRVIDASIMPVITRGSTYAPTIMIGEKGSHMIKEDWDLF